MDDPPFDLAKFDPSTLDLSHLHQGEQDRIKNRQFDSRELSLLLSGQNPWTKSGKPQPLPSTPLPSEEPNVEETNSASGDLKGWEHLLDTPEAREMAEDLERQRRSLKAIFGPRDESRSTGAYQTPMDMLRAAAIAEAQERARQEIRQQYEAERENLAAQLIKQNESPGQVEKHMAGPSHLPSEPPNDLPAGPPPQHPVREKAWKLGESNIFMGGGVGMALAAYAFLMAGAPRFAIILLCVAWLIISISIYRHQFLEGRSPRVQILGNAFACLGVALLFVVSWFLLVPSQQQLSSIPTKTESTANDNVMPGASVSVSPSLTPSTIPVATAPEKTLHDYFNEQGGNCWRETIKQEIRLEEGKFKVEAQMCMDFNKKAQHLAFYVPYTDRTLEVCSRLISQHLATIREFIDRYQGQIEVGPIEGRQTQVKDLRFTRYLVIFHEASLSQDKLDALEKHAKMHHLIVEYHSSEYVMARMPK